MLLEIQGENTGSFIMFGDIATQLLKMMGQSGQPEGAIREADVPAALAKLKSALDNLPAEQQVGDDDSETQQVSLRTRAKPMLDLLEQSAEKGGFVMWKPQ